RLGAEVPGGRRRSSRGDVLLVSRLAPEVKAAPPVAKTAIYEGGTRREGGAPSSRREADRFDRVVENVLDRGLCRSPGSDGFGRVAGLGQHRAHAPGDAVVHPLQRGGRVDGDSGGSARSGAELSLQAPATISRPVLSGRLSLSRDRLGDRGGRGLEREHRGG